MSPHSQAEQKTVSAISAQIDDFLQGFAESAHHYLSFHCGRSFLEGSLGAAARRAPRTKAYKHFSLAQEDTKFCEPPPKPKKKSKIASGSFGSVIIILFDVF